MSRTIARAMCLNEDLAEAIAFGHDVGHTPFGHLGEVVLSDIMYGNHGDKCGFPQENYGGFKHNYQSLRVLDQLEQKYSYPGLNLSAPVREGILKHTRLKKMLFPIRILIMVICFLSRSFHRHSKDRSLQLRMKLHNARTTWKMDYVRIL